MAESSLWNYLRKNMRGHGHWIRIENSVELGTPDVNGCMDGEEIWIELKALKDWPKRASTQVKIKHYTKEQKQWILDRHHAGGNAFLFARVAREYFLFKPGAAQFVDKMTREQWHEYAHMHSINRVDWDEFRRKLLWL